MRHFNEEKTDVVSVILDDHELLDTFVETLQIESERAYDDFSLTNIRASSLGRIHKYRCYLLGHLKTFLHKIAQKTQVLAILADYHAKREALRIKKIK